MTPYVCGVHMNSPHNPHHAGASGGSDINNIETSPTEEKYLLYGKLKWNKKKKKNVEISLKKIWREKKKKH